MQKHNLILIVVDALRPDFLSCYGYGKAKTENIDAIAERGCLFSNAYSVSCVTPVVFGTLFTGTYPFQHGVREFSYVLNDRFPTIAEIFSKNGYKTGAILGSIVMDKSRGFHRGFDYYDDDFGVRVFSTTERSFKTCTIRISFVLERS